MSKLDPKVLGVGKCDIDFRINHEILQSIQDGSMEDYAYGCIIGAFCGDTCGSFLQFSKTIVDEQTMDKCMKLPGGGPFGQGGVGPSGPAVSSVQVPKAQAIIPTSSGFRV